MLPAKKVMAPLIAASLAFGSVAAHAAPVRASSDVAEAEALGGGSFLLYIALLAAAVGLIVIVSDDDLDIPTSP
ncbi:hypothetical protein [Tsuneonella sp. HG222]